jgi:hypothetical protein
MLLRELHAQLREVRDLLPEACGEPLLHVLPDSVRDGGVVAPDLDSQVDLLMSA